MSDSDVRLLDRPIWSALTTSHQHLAEGGPRALRYPLDMTPFADMVDMSAASFAALGDLMSGSQVAALFTPETLYYSPCSHFQGNICHSHSMHLPSR